MEHAIETSLHFQVHSLNSVLLPQKEIASDRIDCWQRASGEKWASMVCEEVFRSFLLGLGYYCDCD